MDHEDVITPKRDGPAVSRPNGSWMSEAFLAWIRWDAATPEERKHIVIPEPPSGPPPGIEPEPLSPAAQRWLEENKAAIEAYNRWDEANELWIDQFSPLD